MTLIQKNSLMKKNKTILLIVFSFFTSVVIAQDILPEDTFVVVTKYNPVLSDAFKIKDNPTIKDDSKIIPSLKYNFLNKKIPVSFTPELIKPAKIKGEPLVKLYNGYAKLGLGTNLTPLAELYYNNNRSKKYAFGFYGKHLSSTGITKIDHSEYSDNHLELFGKKFLKKYTLYSKFGYDRNVIHHYGFPSENSFSIANKDSIKQRFNLFNASAGVRRNYTDTNQVDYDFNVDYHNLTDLLDVSEDHITIDGNLSKYHRKELYQLGATVNYNDLNNIVDSSSNLTIALNPQISTIAKKWRFNIGLGLFINSKDETTFHFYPKAEFKYNVVAHIIIPYIGVKGGIIQNNLRSFYGDNPFLNTTQLQNTNTNMNYDFYGGIRGSISSKITFNTSVRKQQIEGLPLYVKDYTDALQNKFQVIYDSVNILNIRGEITYQKLEKIKVFLSGDYYEYETENELKAWHKPKYRITLSGIYDLKNKILVKMDLFATSKQYAKVYTSTTSGGITTTIVEAKELSAFFDANLSLEYRYTKKLSVFLNFNNIASVKYQRWQDYPTQQFGVLGGLTYSF